MLCDMNKDSEKGSSLIIWELPFYHFLTILTICLRVIVDDNLGHTKYSLYNHYSFFPHLSLRGRGILVVFYLEELNLLNKGAR